MATVEEFWYSFLEKSGRPKDERYAGELSLESLGFANDAQIALMLSGKKSAFFTSLATYAIDNEELPLADECYIVLDRSGAPRCVIELLSVQIVPFNEVTWDMAMLEGEDSDLKSWQEKHREYLEEEAEIVGFNFEDNIKLVFQKFHTIYS